MSQPRYNVVALPDKHLSWTNNVYVNPQNTLLLNSGMVQVNGKMIYGVSSHPEVGIADIALNAMQRNSSDVSQGAPTEVISYRSHLSEEEQVAMSIKADVDTIGKSRCEVTEQVVIDAFSQRFKGQMACVGMIFALEVKGLMLKVTITHVEVVKPGGGGGDHNMSESKSSNEDDGSHVLVSAEYGTIATESTLEMFGPVQPKVGEAAVRPLLNFIKNQASKKPKLLDPKWKFEDMGIGGLDKEFSSIFRRAFASRLFPPNIMKAIGVRHVKGMLLYGPPGTGKTLIARQIGKMLAGKEPKVVNGPEILNKFVGQSEENIRKLFQEAEEDQRENGDNSELHIIIFDEIDAICKKRGTTGGGTGVNDTVVNQILTKMDGVESLNNILVIGMTNRKDMMDPALLRPGRLEVHVEISLPDEFGRQQIFKIHTKDMKLNKHLADDVMLEKLAEMTKNFSGAEIEGVVKNASSFAMNNFLDVTTGAPKIKGNMKDLKVTMAHFDKAIEEAHPAFGSEEKDFSRLTGPALIDYGRDYQKICETVKTLMNQIKISQKTNMLTVLLEGANGTGKTALAASLALQGNFPYLKLISADNFVGMNEIQKASAIAQVFDDAHKSPLSLIVIDNIERLLEYIHIGPRFSNVILQTLLVLLQKAPNKADRKLMVIGTTSSFTRLKPLEIKSAFNVILNVPMLTSPQQVLQVMQSMSADGGLGDLALLESISQECALPIGIKQLLLVLEMATQDSTKLTLERFQECLEDCGLETRRNEDSERIRGLLMSGAGKGGDDDMDDQ